MVRKDFIDFIGKTGNKELIEKDILLHSILYKLAKDEWFKENFAFKGGTCLIKCHFGYYRFSEDLDFTYLSQKEFEGKSEKQIRKTISEKVDRVSALLSDVPKEFETSFKPEKDNSKYFEFGGGNKLTTFKIWYKSKIAEKESFVKVQINFVEKLFYPIIKLEALSSINESFEKDVKFLFPEYDFIFEPIKINAYSLDEILIEKIRAMLTRKGVKARDVIDIFLIVKKDKINLNLLKKQCIEKTEFMLRYEKYSDNIQIKDFESLDGFVLGEEAKLLIKEVPRDFDKFLGEFKLFLQSLIKEIRTLNKFER